MDTRPSFRVALASLAIGLVLGWILTIFIPLKCDSGGDADRKDTTRRMVVDTTTVRRPVVEDATKPLGEQIYKLAVSSRGESSGITGSNGTIAGLTVGADTAIQLYGTGSGGEPRQRPDSATVEIPITQKHYRDSTYEAWVSGFAQNLDSIRIYSRRETITIREYQGAKRWHLGVCAGYAYTPRGFHPYIGIGVTYSLFSWK